MTSDQTPLIIGWRERVDLPEWGLRRVRAKIDTGARTSAIDVAQFEMIGEDRVRFEVVARNRPKRRTKWIVGTHARTSRVKPSPGCVEDRVVCITRLKINDVERDIEVSLVCRKGMLCRMLIGRTALQGILVDPSRKYVATARAKPNRNELP